MFKPVKSKVDLVKLENNILEFWKNNKIFQKSLKNREGSKKFIFYEGPPTANAKPGVHHVLARSFKDIFSRYQTMKGYYVPRKGGWDTHGLPVELEIEKKLGVDSKKEIEEIGIKRFSELCKQSVFEYVEDWVKLTDRIGFWLDMSDAYYTFTNNYIETVWWILKQIYDKDLLYKGYKVVTYCPRCGTPLSSHEVAQGYKEVEDPSVYVKFKLKDEDSNFLVWTTTPWTLLSNVALAVNLDEDYVEISKNNEKLILAKTLLEDVIEQPYQILRTFKGKDLTGKRYEPLFNYTNIKNDCYLVVGADFVSLKEGTGIVHIAPAFGVDDMNLAREKGLPIIQLVNESGKIKKKAVDFAGLFVKKADPEIIKNLIQRKILFKEEKILHSYPHCWRCDTPLLYFARKSWFIATSTIKDKLLKSNSEINWYPDHIKYGRFGNWLENNIDWSLSRERYWGTPLPIWEDNSGHRICIGSMDELKKLAKHFPDKLDLHRPYIDEINLICPECKAEMSRVKEVIDCWFDSGSMPYAQLHYPFENYEKFHDNFPADFICEALDQTRGWFYTMMAISTILFEKSSYKNVVCLGLINDKYGRRMSKSRGNTVDPWSVLNNQGADALRWYLFTSSSPWVNKNFDVGIINEIIKRFILTLWNSYSFFVVYANIDKFNPEKYSLKFEERSVLDKWILSELNQTISTVDESLNNYDATRGGKEIEQFVNKLSNWYIRRSRRRFWKSEEDKDKISAYLTLYECLVTIAKLLAPYMPFISEEIYQNLVLYISKDSPESIHLTDFPISEKRLIDKDLMEQMNLVRKVVSLGRSARNKASIKVRQPLSYIKVFKTEQTEKLINYKAVIKDELNVKSFELTPDLKQILNYKVKPNLELLGPKYGSKVSVIKNILERMNHQEIANTVLANEKVKIKLEEQEEELLPEEILIEIVAPPKHITEKEGEIALTLNTVLSKKLLDEGFIRELVRLIQNQRKGAGFRIENTIKTIIDCSEKERKIIEEYKDYLCKETLTSELVFSSTLSGNIEEFDIEKTKIRVGISISGPIT
ncbi:MAG: isoleucine--tRNA ligase [Actinomycetota bacterium]